MTQITKKASGTTLLILLLILIAGTSLRLYHLDSYSIFFDEKSTLVVSQGIVLEGANQKEVFSVKHLAVPEFWKTPGYQLLPPDVITSLTYTETYSPRTFTPKEFWSHKKLSDYYEAMTRSDIGNSPFYYLLIHGWMDIFGMSDFSARLFSVLFSVLIIGLTFLFARKFFDDNTALIASAIVAIEPFFIAYSHQARNYSLTFFLTLLATYFFLQIIENKASKQKTIWLYIGYILAAGLSLLSHFLTISVLLAHAIYALFFLRSIKGWIRMGAAAVAALSGVTWWLIAGGGQYTLYSLNYQSALYKRVAETMPNDNPYGLILPATLGNVFNKALPIFSDLIIFTNGLTDGPVGKRNTVVAFLAGIVLILWFRFRDKINPPAWLESRLPYILILVSTLFYTSHKAQFAILSVSLFALSFLPDIHKKSTEQQKKRLWLLYIMALVPTFFLIVMAFRGGHTFGLTQRYSGFSFPYVIIVLSLLLQYFTSLPREFRLVLFVFLALQLYYVGLRLNDIYQDRSLKYSYFLNPRSPNPYYAAAQKIKETYQKGDTIYYPAPVFPMVSVMDRTFLSYSIREAQITNLYLPKDADYTQAMDTTQTTKIFIVRSTPSKDTLEIMDLKGKQY
jgi:uncharacterized membrane protein